MSHDSSTRIRVFLETETCFPITENYASTCSVCESFSPVHTKTLKQLIRACAVWCMTSSYQKNLCLRPRSVHTKTRSRRFRKKLLSRDCLRKPAFTCGRKADIKRRKNKKRSRYVWTGSRVESYRRSFASGKMSNDHGRYLNLLLKPQLSLAITWKLSIM